MNFRNLMSVGLAVLFGIAGGPNLLAQHLHYSTLSGYCVDEELCQSSPEDECQHSCHFYSDGRYHWQNDQFAEEQFEDSSWPSRRDDELSDQLMR